MRTVLALALFLLLSNAKSADLVTGSVSFSEGLYTYSYSMDASLLPPGRPGFRVIGLNILVNSAFDFDTPPPLLHTEPNSFWQFNVSVGGQFLPEPVKIAGSFWAWGYLGNTPLPTSGPLLFSFTTPTAPDISGQRNYNVYAAAGTSGPPGFEQWIAAGTVVGPMISPVPEPEMYVLMLAGLGMIACKIRRRTAS